MTWTFEYAALNAPVDPTDGKPRFQRSKNVWTAPEEAAKAAGNLLAGNAINDWIVVVRLVKIEDEG